MIQSSDILEYENAWFDGDRYIQLQTQDILDRIEKFSGKLYLEIGGKFLYDAHAARVLPGFYPDSKRRIFKSLAKNADVIFCVNAKDLDKNRSLWSDGQTYIDTCLEMIKDINKKLWIMPKISINRVKDKNLQQVQSFQELLKEKELKSYLRYEIAGYPEDVDSVLSDSGYWNDQHIPCSKNLVLVVGAASSSGKMSTCLGQIYLDHWHWMESGYAKYETFPIWNLHLEHPVNLAYEAATADIWDYNLLDIYHANAYREEAINYNRDIEAFEIIQQLAEDFLPKNNYTRQYQSPTDMWISNAGFCIIDEDIVEEAAIAEINRRKDWYKEVNDDNAVKICKKILKKIHS
jgi:uncharacterized protein (UPF0371 family)